jgi:hypothetical protein
MKIRLVMKKIFKHALIIPATVLACMVYGQVPVLNSLPGAAAATPTILLDFDGHTVTGTIWGSSIVCQPAGLSTAEITEVFNRVAEDFRPFGINITTDEAKYTAAPVTKRMRVILTISHQWYGSGAGGVAMVSSFTWGDETPCFVFTALLSNNVKRIAEAASHESGHTLGLYHQAVYDANCNYVSDYNQGTGSGEIGWAPIMGVGYYRNFTVWHNGPNPNGCNQLQSDLDIITSASNGVSFRTDDHNSTFALATTATFSSNQFTVQGIIERNTDQDMFKFTLQNEGRFVLNAVPYNVGTGNAGSNLDMQVSLYSNSQVLLNVFNPGTLLSSVIDTILAGGNYYLRVEGRGNANAPAYASLGSYSLQGNFTGGALPLRRLELSGAAQNRKHQLSWIIDADEQVTDLSLETATDGRNFEPLVQQDVQARAFAYTPPTAQNRQYRLNVTFDNGRQYYSNVVRLRGFDNTSKPQLAGTILNTNTITVNSPAVFRYEVHDINGKLLLRGNLNNGINKINSAGLVTGMYVIRFTQVDGTQWIEKFIRQ